MGFRKEFLVDNVMSKLFKIQKGVDDLQRELKDLQALSAQLDQECARMISSGRSSAEFPAVEEIPAAAT